MSTDISSLFIFRQILCYTPAPLCQIPLHSIVKFLYTPANPKKTQLPSNQQIIYFGTHFAYILLRTRKAFANKS